MTNGNIDLRNPKRDQRPEEIQKVAYRGKRECRFLPRKMPYKKIILLRNRFLCAASLNSIRKSCAHIIRVRVCAAESFEPVKQRDSRARLVFRNSCAHSLITLCYRVFFLSRHGAPGIGRRRRLLRLFALGHSSFFMRNGTRKLYIYIFLRTKRLRKWTIHGVKDIAPIYTQLRAAGESFAQCVCTSRQVRVY